MSLILKTSVLLSSCEHSSITAWNSQCRPAPLGNFAHGFAQCAKKPAINICPAGACRWILPSEPKAGLTHLAKPVTQLLKILPSVADVESVLLHSARFRWRCFSRIRQNSTTKCTRPNSCESDYIPLMPARSIECSGTLHIQNSL